MSAATLVPAVERPATAHRPDRPDRQELRRLAVPQTEPAAAQRIELEPPTDPVPSGQGRLELPAPGPPVGRLRSLLVDTAVPESSVPLPDPQAWVARFVQAAVEVAAGTRPASQLVRWTTLEVQALLVRRAAMTARFDRAAASRRRAVVRTVIVCLPAQDVCEASAVVYDGDRVRAVALRAEALDDRWRVTALQLG